MNLKGKQFRRKVFVFIHRPAEPVRLTEEYINASEEKEELRKMNEKGWFFSLNLVRSVLYEDDCISALSFLFQDVTKTLPPVVNAELFTKDEDDALRGILQVPRMMFGKFHSNILIIRGDLTDEEISKKVEEWTHSLTTTT